MFQKALQLNHFPLRLRQLRQSQSQLVQAVADSLCMLRTQQQAALITIVPTAQLQPVGEDTSLSVFGSNLLIIGYGNMANGTIETGQKLKTATIKFVLPDYTWTASASGKYYIQSSDSPSVPNATKVVAVSINDDWTGLRSGDSIIPFIMGSNKVSLMSNVNSFYYYGSSISVDVLFY